MSNSIDMNDMNTKKNIVERIQKKIKKTNLRPEEIQAIDKARRQVYNHTSVGGFFGAVGTFLLGRKRRMSPFFMIPFVSGGFLIGSQVGMISGIMSGMRTINKLPDQARLVNLVKDIQQEVMEAGGYTRDDATGRPRPMTPDEKHQYQQKLLNEKNDETFVRNEQQQQQQQDKNDDPWWIDSDSSINGNNSFSNPTNNNNDDVVWKDDGDAYMQGNSNNSNNNDGNGSAWDRIRKENN